jgi:LacI family transcriptional regulator
MWDRERRDAFRGFLAKRGYHASVYLPPAGTDADAELASLTTWLRSLPKPCGLFVSNDIRAMHVLTVCRAEGIAVPEQLQVVGTDNEEWICDRTSPSLTSVEPDFEGCGHRAAETLLAMMDGGPWVREQTFGVRRVEQRMSTTDIHGSANRAVRAREYLRAHASEPLGTARLAAILGCSPRLLQLSYKAVFGCTVQEDLQEARLDLARKLLAENRVPICDIAECVGFESPFHLMKLFKKRTGMTMLQWRKRCGS